MTEKPSLYSRIWNAVWNGAGLCDDECRDITCNVMAALGDDDAFPTWQPIETAPKDWSDILIWSQDGICVGFWDESLEDWVSDLRKGQQWVYGATHWMPLPAPPKGD